MAVYDTVIHGGMIIDEFGDHPGHIFNLGHGIHPAIDPERVAVLVDTVHRVSRRTN